MGTKLFAVLVSAALLQGCSSMPEMSDKAQMSEPDSFASFVGSSSNSGVLTGSGNCLRSAGWSSENMVVECQASSKPTEAMVPVQPPKQLAKLSFDGTALFAFDSAQLSSDGRRELNNLITQLDGNSSVGQITVVGHADSVGGTQYNQGLSERRASAVRQFLKGALSNAQVVMSGMGEAAPVADNSTSTGRQRNRRVEVQIDAISESNAVFN